MDGWTTSFLLGWPIFRGYVSFRECKRSPMIVPWHSYRMGAGLGILFWGTASSFYSGTMMEYVKSTWMSRWKLVSERLGIVSGLCHPKEYPIYK